MSNLNRKTTVMLVVLVFGSFVTLLNQTLVAPALPTIMREFSIDTATAQWLTTAFMLVNAIMIPITAFMQERFSVRGLFVCAMSIFAVASVLCGWSPNFPVLLGGRCLQAVGAGIMMPMTMSVIMTSFPMEKRGSAMGIVGTVFATAPAIGPTASGFMVVSVGWHLMFYIIAGLCIFVIVAGIFFMESKVSEKAKEATLDIPSVVFSTIGLGCLLYGLSVFGNSGLNVIDGFLMLLGIVSIVLFCRRQLRLEKPMLEIRVLKNRDFLVSVVIGMSCQAAVLASGVLMPVYVQTILGYSAIVSGLAVLPGSIFGAIASPIAGRRLDRKGPRAVVIFGMIMLFFSNLGFGFLTIDGSVLVVVFMFILRQIGVGIANMTSTTWGMYGLDDTLVPHASSVSNTLRMVAGSLGTALVVSISTMVQNNLTNVVGETQATMTGINAAYLSLAVFIGIALLLSIIYVKDHRHLGEETDRFSIGNIISEETNRAVIAAIMKRDVYTLSKDETVENALTYLVEHNISGAPVVDENNRAIGFFSDGDFLARLANLHPRFGDPLTMLAVTAAADIHADEDLQYLMSRTVEDLCVQNCICAAVNANIGEVCRKLSEYHLKKLPIVDGGVVVGIINRSDVTKYAIETFVKDSD